MIRLKTFLAQETLGESSSSLQLAIFRIAVFAAIWYAAPSHYKFAESLYNGQGLWEGMEFVPKGTFDTLYSIWKWSMIAALVGFGGRWLLFLGGFSSFLLFSYAFNFNTFHSSAGLCFAALVLAFSRANDQLSIDHTIKALLNKNLQQRTFPKNRYDFAYLWPLRLIQTYIICVYFSSAITKLLTSGWTWALSDNIPMLLLDSPMATPLADVALSLPWTVLKVGAFAVLLLELISPVMILTPKTRWIFALEITLFQITVTSVMGGHEGFLSYPILFLLTLNWDKLVQKLRDHFSATGGVISG